MRLQDEKLTHNDLTDFMNKNGFSDREFANLFGVTVQAVRLWKTGERVFTVTNSRLLRLFIKYPTLIKDFGRV